MIRFRLSRRARPPTGHTRAATAVTVPRPRRRTNGHVGERGRVCLSRAHVQLKPNAPARLAVTLTSPSRRELADDQ
jgi:hypothetical protein